MARVSMVVNDDYMWEYIQFEGYPTSFISWKIYTQEKLLKTNDHFVTMYKALVGF